MKKFNFLFLIIVMVSFFGSVPRVNAVSNNLLFNSASFYNGGSTISTSYGNGGAGGVNVYYFQGSQTDLSTEQLALNLNQTHLTNNYVTLNDYNYLYMSVASTFYIPGAMTLVSTDNTDSIVCLPYSSGTTPIIEGSGMDASEWNYAYTWTTFQCDLSGLSKSFAVWNTVIGLNRINVASGRQDSTSVVFINKNVYLTKSPEKQVIDELNNQTEELKDSISSVDDTLNNSNIDNSSSTANSFFEGFNTNDYGLSDIVTMPLELISGLTSNSCVSLSLTLPFVNKTFELPCMSSIYQEYFGGFYNLYQIVTFGFISYWVIVRIFNLVKDFKNPDHDEIEVLDL